MVVMMVLVVVMMVMVMVSDAKQFGQNSCR